MEKQGVLQFDIEGEYLTSLAREWFYVEGKGYDKCIELLNGCMSGTDETKDQIRRHAEDLLLGRAAQEKILTIWRYMDLEAKKKCQNI